MFLHHQVHVIPAHISSVQGLCSCFIWWVEGKDLTWFAATVELTWLVQLTEMSGTSNSGYFVCLLWKGCLNGSLVTNSTWRLTSIYPHFLSGSSFLSSHSLCPVFVSLSHGPSWIFDSVNANKTQCVSTLKQQIENISSHNVQLILHFVCVHVCKC